MKFLMKKIDLFCYKHPRFGINNLMLYIVAGNVAVWLFSWFAPEILYYLYFSPYHILHGEVWRLVTFIFFPIRTDFLAIVAFYFYFWIGRTLESEWGPGKFTIFLFSGVLLTIVYCFIVYAFTKVSLDATASYIYLSLFMAFATLFPNTWVNLFFFLPIRVKWLALFDAAIFAYAIVVDIAGGQVFLAMLPVVAFLNYLLFCGGWLFGQRLPTSRQARKNTQEFKQEVRQIRYEQQTKPYSRKCEVCGRTDVSDPTLEFRYCSRCQGYHCFCIDHINDHQHFTE